MARGAKVVAEYLQQQPKVSRLSYPGLHTHPNHDSARKQMEHGFGGMLAFDVGHHQEDARRFINGLQTIYHAVSLGATESLICIPYLTTMLYLPPERRTGFGVRKNTVRLSIGIEPADKLGLASICGQVLRTGGTAKWTGDQIDLDLQLGDRFREDVTAEIVAVNYHEKYLDKKTGGFYAAGMGSAL